MKEVKKERSRMRSKGQQTRLWAEVNTRPTAELSHEAKGKILSSSNHHFSRSIAS